MFYVVGVFNSVMGIKTFNTNKQLQKFLNDFISDSDNCIDIVFKGNIILQGIENTGKLKLSYDDRWQMKSI